MMSERDRLALTWFSAQVMAKLKSAGFKVAVVETGGGCTAIEVWLDNDGWDALITNGDLSHRITSQKCLVVSTVDRDQVDYTTILDAHESASGVSVNDVVKVLTEDYTRYIDTMFDREKA